MEISRCARVVVACGLRHPPTNGVGQFSRLFADLVKLFEERGGLLWCQLISHAGSIT